MAVDLPNDMRHGGISGRVAACVQSCWGDETREGAMGWRGRWGADRQGGRRKIRCDTRGFLAATVMGVVRAGGLGRLGLMAATVQTCL